MTYTLSTHPELYNKWLAMKYRCYSTKELSRRPSYNGCTVHEDWINNFQQFAFDIENMVGYGLPNRQLDKDILVKGNKIYSNDTCVLVPSQINTLLLKSDKSRGNLPIGVTGERSKYRAQLRIFNKRKFLGYYDTPEEAFTAYKHTKENYIKEVAELYKHELDPRAYTALMNWEILQYD